MTIDSHANIAAALAAFQASIPSVVKGQQATVTPKDGGRSYTYEYADLAVITPIAMPLLGQHGLSFTSRPTLMGPAFVLEYALMHETGESLEGVYPLPDPVTTKPQTLGSAITYARRYAFCAVTGIAPGGDDDDAQAANGDSASAVKASAARKPAAGRKPRAQAQVDVPVPVAATNWTLQIADATTVEDLRKIHGKVEGAGELGVQFDQAHRANVEQLAEQHGLDKPPATVTVAQMLGAVRKAIESKPEPVESEPSAEDIPAALADWNVVEIPTDEEPEP